VNGFVSQLAIKKTTSLEVGVDGFFLLKGEKAASTQSTIKKRLLEVGISIHWCMTIWLIKSHLFLYKKEESDVHPH